jgi:hypothetical protein
MKKQYAHARMRAHVCVYAHAHARAYVSVWEKAFHLSLFTLSPGLSPTHPTLCVCVGAGLSYLPPSLSLSLF